MELVQLLGLQGPWQCRVCRDPGSLRRRSHGTYRLFPASGSWRSETFWLVLLCCSACQALKCLPWLGSFLSWCTRYLKGSPAGVLLCCSLHQVRKRPPSLGLPQLVSGWCRHVGREATVTAPPLAMTHSIALPPQLSGIPPKAFPPQSPPWRPLKWSPHSQQQTLPWDCSPVYMLQLPAPTHSGRLVSLSREGRGCHKGCLCGSHSIQTVIDQLLHSPSASTVPKYCPAVGI